MKLTGKEDGFTYIWQDVPIKVSYIDPEDELFKQPDKVNYHSWDYLIPNPFKEYLKTL